MIVRRDELRASKAMQHRVMNNPKIEILWNHNTKEIVGEKMGFNKAVNGAILLNNKTNEEKRIDISGFFVAIGHKPNSSLFTGQVDLDDAGYIKTIPGSTRTNIPGVFAAGDIQDTIYRQAITAAGSGCMAAIESERFIGENE
jgi:thioredoxin reductase (NADPH)